MINVVYMRLSNYGGVADDDAIMVHSTIRTYIIDLWTIAIGVISPFLPLAKKDHVVTFHKTNDPKVNDASPNCGVTCKRYDDNRGLFLYMTHYDLTWSVLLKFVANKTYCTSISEHLLGRKNHLLIFYTAAENDDE